MLCGMVNSRSGMFNNFFEREDCVDDNPRCIGVGSSAALQTAALLIRKKESIREIEKLCHAHPAINESVQECARMLLGRSIYKPHIWPRSYLKHWSPEKGQAYAEELIPKRFRQTVPGYINE